MWLPSLWNEYKTNDWSPLVPAPTPLLGSSTVCHLGAVDARVFSLPAPDLPSGCIQARLIDSSNTNSDSSSNSKATGLAV